MVVSQTGFTGEKGYEIYLRDATLHAEEMWNAVLEAGKAHNLAVIAPAHHRRVAAGILSWGQDMDAETLPFQVNLGYQVPRTKEADYIGKAALEAARDARRGRATRRSGRTLVGLRLGGKPIDEYAPDFWLVRDTADGEPDRLRDLAVVLPRARDATSRWATCRSSCPRSAPSCAVDLPDQVRRRRRAARCAAEVVEMPFRPSVNPNTRERLKVRGLDSAV